MTVEQWYTDHDDEEHRLAGFSIEWERSVEIIGLARKAS